MIDHAQDTIGSRTTLFIWELCVVPRKSQEGISSLESETSFTGIGSGLLHVGFNFDLGWFEVGQFARVKVLVGLEV